MRRRSARAISANDVKIASCINRAVIMAQAQGDTKEVFQLLVDLSWALNVDAREARKKQR